jgi:lipopolysaccharide export system protein LptA
MTAWQKRARVVMALVGLSVIGMVAMTLHRREPARPEQPVTRVDPKAVAETAGGRYTEATGTKIPGEVQFDRSLTYADGTTRLLGATITTERSGRRFVVGGRELLAGKDQSNVTMTGDVRLASSDGLQARAQKASYARAEGIVRAPGPVSFSKGTLSGTAIGMTYDDHRDVLWLLDAAHVIVRPDGKGSRGADIRAGAAGYARRDKYMRFERGVHLVRDTQHVEADTATAYLSDDGNRLQSLELRGTSRISTPGAVDGGLRGMQAENMNLTYADDGETLQHAVLAGRASIEMAAKAGPGRRIAGDSIEMGFGPTGDLTAITGQNHVVLTMPAANGVPARVIKAARMEGTGEPGQGLTSATFLGGVEFAETRAPGEVRLARARTLAVAMAPGSGEIQTARFSGSTRFADGALRATAADGEYRIAQGMLALTGTEGPNDPRVQNERITVDAQRIDLTFEGTKLLANGRVRSVLKPAPKNADPKAPKERVPGMLKNDQPVNVTAGALDYSGDSSLATYTGAARLWQGDTTILGETIVLDEKSGDLKAHENVRTTFTLEQVDQKTNRPTEVPSVASAQDLHYEDALRRATYTTDAHVNGPQGDCHAVRILMYFAASGNTLERAEAYEKVTVLSEGRTATGAQMTYFAAEERYFMVGAPVTILEECRETTGKTLTFWRSTDRIVVDGNDTIRTLTRNNSSGATPACTQARPQ